jgi:SAM-dependent methyltransferase
MPIHSMKASTSRQQKIAAVFATEIWPLVPERAAELLLRGLPARPATRAFEVGCSDGRLSLQIAERLAPGGRLTAIDGSPAMIALAEAEQARRVGGVGGGGEAKSRRSNVSFQVCEASPPFPVGDGECDLVFSNLGLADAPERGAGLRALAGCLDHGGTLLATFPLRGCWAEFLDIYRDVLTEQRNAEALAALRTYEDDLPDPTVAARWLESAGLTQISVQTMRWELLFKSAREFFFSPVVELGPLPLWKQIAGGRGDAMQDVFLFVKEAIDAYFLGAAFPVTMVVGCLKAEQP